MSLSSILFIIGIIGFVLNKKNIILLLISIEIMLLSVTLYILLLSSSYEDLTGQILGLYVIILAGAESAIGLSIILSYYRLRGNINIDSTV